MPRFIDNGKNLKYRITTNNNTSVIDTTNCWWPPQSQFEHVTKESNNNNDFNLQISAEQINNNKCDTCGTEGLWLK